ncbi:DUF3995 domain-containing protein [Tenacibaculum sp. M341]|uniref:DUF3995 domain-containing protein n=1 Tax=Tenacibaculum sp. M341 TaxID=2530339 RepID=UPI00104E734E|nr:DUF3995 domain-containing protein [Tenacibaculum sp. M341]TCI84561.1 DUF3995 domain-containing protein [Tenacibaculum sp. M341]
MVFFLSLLSSLILFIVSIFHVYWAFGGHFGVESVIPKKLTEDENRMPPAILTLIVAMVFFAMGILFLDKLNRFDFSFIPEFLKSYGIISMGVIFLIRAIGEFNYVGFFKKIKNTKFGINDTKYYSPLCLFLAISAFIIEFTQ